MESFDLLSSSISSDVMEGGKRKAKRGSKKASKKGSKKGSRKQHGGEVPAHLKPFADAKDAVMRLMKQHMSESELKALGNLHMKAGKVAAHFGKNHKGSDGKSNYVATLKEIESLDSGKFVSEVKKALGASQSRSKKGSKKGSSKGSKKGSKKAAKRK